MDDISFNKKNTSKFIVNDNHPVNNDMNIRKDHPSPQFHEEDEQSDGASDFDNDIINQRLYNSDDGENEDNLSSGSYGEDSVASYVDEDSDDIRKQKSFFLFKLKSLEKKGYPPMRMFTMDDKLAKVKGEVERINKEIEMTRGVEFSRQGLLFFTNGLEMMNDRFDPLDLQLSGWSESIASNIDNYDDVFEELYEKYHTKVAVAPEVKLIMMVLGSAFMFHFSKTFAKNSSNVANVMNNPDVMAAMGNAMAKEAKKDAQTPQPQRKMKEPDTNIDDLLAQLETDSANGDDNIKSVPLSKAPKKRGRPKKPEEDSNSMVFDI